MDIKERIVELKKRRDAVIIAHYYAPVEVHEIADVLSDSRGFFELGGRNLFHNYTTSLYCLVKKQ